MNRQNDEVLVHQVSPKRCLRQILVAGLVLFPLIGILFLLSANKQLSNTVPASCTSKLASPHSKYRTVSYEFCTYHDNSVDSVNILNIRHFLNGFNDENVNNSIQFLVLGDFGRDGYCCQRDVAIEMNVVGEGITADFIINTGDSFYEEGISSNLDEAIKTSWKEVYNYSYLRNLDWHGCLGNHDYYGSTTALMSLSKLEPRFLIPNRWYTRQIKFVKFIFIDTNPMIYNYHWEFPLMQEHDDGIQTQWDKVEEQMSWLENEITSNHDNTSSTIVIGHHPIVSGIDYGTENRTFLTERIAPLLEKHSVLAFFGGHDHNLQFGRPNPRSTSYFVSGAGSLLRDGKFSMKGDNFYHVVNGFLACSITKEGVLKVASINMNGYMLDAVEVSIL